MFLNITDKQEAENKGSSAKLVHYLEKENRMYPDQEPEQWFSHDGTTFQGYEVKNRLDNNIAKLCHDDAKFFLINISPSQKEIAHLKALYGEAGAKTELKRFAEKIMDEYALNFKRNNINSNEDLLWFAKLENNRYYSFKDKEVRNGSAKRGEPKPGEQMHIQVIVSRKDLTNKIKLSPMNNSRGKNAEHSKKVGQFDRVAFKASGERVFDERYQFTRPITETFKHANTQANGSLAERIKIAEQASHQEASAEQSRQHPTQPRIQPEEKSLLDLLLSKPDYDPDPKIRKKKRRRRSQQQELTL